MMQTHKTNFWLLLESLVRQDYSDKTVLLYDTNGTAYDDSLDYTPTGEFKLYIFDSLEEAREKINSLKLNIIGYFTEMWVNGEMDKSLIFEMRG